MFPELFEIEYQEDNDDSIVIPTGAQDGGGARDGTKENDKRQVKGGIYPVTVESLNKPASSVYRVSTSASDFTDTSGYSSGRTGHFVDSPGDYVIDSYSHTDAVSTRTGPTVISLDFPSSQYASNKSANSKKPVNQKSKKSKSSKKAVKDKKPKKTTKELTSDVSCFTSSLCITPIPNIIESEEDIDQNLYIYDDDDEFSDLTHDPLMYQEVARLTKSVYKFDKIAYPDLCGALSPFEVEPLYHRKFGVQR